MTDGSRQWWLATGILGVVVAVHFSVILLAIVPLPWIPVAVSGAAYRYVDPLFRQGWWLFAPDPPVFVHAVSARGFLLADPDSTSSPWVEVTGPLVSAVQSNRFAAEGARLSAVLYSTYSLLNPATLQRDTTGILPLPVLESNTDEPASLVTFERAGVIALREAHPAHEFEAVQIKLTLWRIPPISQRHEPLGAPEVEVAFAAVPLSVIGP